MNLYVCFSDPPGSFQFRAQPFRQLVDLDLDSIGQQNVFQALAQSGTFQPGVVLGIYAKLQMTEVTRAYCARVWTDLKRAVSASL